MSAKKPGMSMLVVIVQGVSLVLELPISDQPLALGIASYRMFFMPLLYDWAHIGSTQTSWEWE